MPLISIVIPCYNYAHHLSETLESVKSQLLEDWECIIIDDGSTDSTPEVSRVYTNADSRFRYYRQENQGLSAARNAGVKKIKGRFVQFLDADDLISPEKFSQAIGLYGGKS